MRTKILGRTGIEVSIVGLGGSALGIPDRASLMLQCGPKSEGGVYMNESLGMETVLAALKAGATLIDTAPWYGHGASERIIGRVFRERPKLKEKCIVTTKVGHLYPGDSFNFSYDAVMYSVEASQKRLGQDKFRILYLHDPMDQPMKFVMSGGGAFGALQKLKQQGITENIGVAANDPQTNADYIETGEFDAAVVPNAWTLINQTATKRILPAAVKHNVGLVAAAPIERGLLVTGPIEGVRYLGRESHFPLACLERVSMIKTVCLESHIPLAAVALQWCVRHPQVASAIPGAQFPAEARQNTIAGNYEISEDLWQKITPLIYHWDFPGY